MFQRSQSSTVLVWDLSRAIWRRACRCQLASNIDLAADKDALVGTYKLFIHSSQLKTNDSLSFQLLKQFVGIDIFHGRNANDSVNVSDPIDS